MAKKILIAVDESKNSMKAVNYVARGMEKTGSVTLLSILPDATAACGLDSPSLTPLFKQNVKAFCAIEDTKKHSVKAFMEKAKQTLAKSGFPAKNIAIKIGEAEIPAQLNECSTAEEIWEVLPLKAAAQTWGEEIYFEIPVDHALEKGFTRHTVELGDLGYWPEGSSFCIFFGKTPMSEGDEIRPASSVNVIGKVKADWEVFKTVKDGAAIQIVRTE